MVKSRMAHLVIITDPLAIDEVLVLMRALWKVDDCVEIMATVTCQNNKKIPYTIDCHMLK